MVQSRVPSEYTMCNCPKQNSFQLPKNKRQSAEKEELMEVRGIDPRTSRMLSERSTI